MHWRTEKGLQLLIELVENYGSIHFSPDMIKSRFVFKLGDWYKVGRPLMDAFITERYLVPVFCDTSGKPTAYKVNLEKMKGEGLKISAETWEIYCSILKDKEEKEQWEAKQDVARIARAEPEVKG